MSRVILKPRRAQPFYCRHPWVFAGAIARVEGDPQPGDEVVLCAEDGGVIARGLYNPHSKIRVRLYSWDADTPLDEPLWSQRLDAAIDLRRRLFPEFNAESACRLVFSEADGLSGLVVDRYGDWLLVQLTSLALARRRETIVRLLQEKLQPAGVWLRTEKGIGESEGLDIADGLIAGRDPPRPMFIEERGVRYGVDVVEGHKTGFYLDQRGNRAALLQYLPKQARLLDLFCYSGGFGLAAAIHGGATHLVGVDVSEPALRLARGNVELNGVAERFEFEQGRAFDVLERFAAERRRFDAVILDPPKLARSRAGVKKALQAYHQLNVRAVGLLEPDGLLLTCSCSGLVSFDEFVQMLAGASLRSGRRLQILERRGAAPDHPTSASCLETDYLKCVICRVVER